MLFQRQKPVLLTMSYTQEHPLLKSSGGIQSTHSIFQTPTQLMAYAGRRNMTIIVLFNTKYIKQTLFNMINYISNSVTQHVHVKSDTCRQLEQIRPRGWRQESKLHVAITYLIQFTSLWLSSTDLFFQRFSRSPMGLRTTILGIAVQDFFMGQMPYLSPNQQCQCTK